MSNNYDDEGLFIGEHKYCLQSEYPKYADGKDRRTCNSSNALAIYEHVTREGFTWYDGTCFSCKQMFTREEIHTSSLAPELGIDVGVEFVKTPKVFENKASKKEPITIEERAGLWEKTQSEAGGYRGFEDWVLKFYGHRTEVNQKGVVVAQYYPETVEGKISGYKSKHNPALLYDPEKRYGLGNLGRTGINSQLSGQHKFPDGGKYCLIVGGEDDKVAAQQMLRAYQRTRCQEGYDHYCVVSPTTGEPSAHKQCRVHYEWFDKFDVIVIGMDNDDVGDEASEAIAKVLPAEKVKIAKWSISYKDPNKMLQEGRSKQFISNFHDAKEYVKSGLVESNQLGEKIREALRRPRLPLPDVMMGLQECTKGAGFITGRIYNIIGDTSVGKTTFINTMSHFWFFLARFKVGIMSLEATAGEYGIDVLSYHLSTNLYWVDADNIEDFMEDPELLSKEAELLSDDHGASRFVVLDERTGCIKALQAKMERMHKQHGCDIIVLDVATDFLRTLTQEQQAEAFNWQSNFVKEGVTIFNILHTKKPPSLRDGMPRKPDEYDALGNSIFVQKAAGNMVIYRNKMCEAYDEIEANSTYWDVPKMRQGATGDRRMVLYYDKETRRVVDRAKYFEENPDKLPLGYDLSVSSFDKAYYQEGGRGHVGGEDGGKGGYTKGSSKAPSMPIKVDHESIEIDGMVVDL